MQRGLLVPSWHLLLMLSAPSESLSLTVQMSISGNSVTLAQQLHWKLGDENNPAAEASSSSMMPIYARFNEGTE